MFDIKEKQIKDALEKMYRLLKENEEGIIANNISERAITHKMAEYLKISFPQYDVDCEYNRNYDMGSDSPKYIQLLTEEYIKQEKSRIANFEHNNATAYVTKYVDDPICCYPDIIVHKRMSNRDNLLVIEVKKDNNNSSSNDIAFDYRKLRALTKSKKKEENTVFVMGCIY